MQVVCCSQATGSHAELGDDGVEQADLRLALGLAGVDEPPDGAAPTRLIAIGRKMMVLAVFSPRGAERSVSDRDEQAEQDRHGGTMMIQSRVLNSVCWKAGRAEQVGVVLKPTNAG